LIQNLPAKWDLETDVVSVGSGGGGLAAAITAHEHGARALVLERSDQVGGVTAFSMGEVWIPGNHYAIALGINDSPESGYRYIKQLSIGYADDGAVLNQSVHGPVALKYFADKIGLKMSVIRDCPDYYYPSFKDSVAEGRLLEVEPFPAESLGAWQAKTRLSPHVPYGMTHADIFHNGGAANLLKWDYSVMSARLAKDERCLGPGLGLLRQRYARSRHFDACRCQCGGTHRRWHAHRRPARDEGWQGSLCESQSWCRHRRRQL
jgi:3-oxosteroid 1-dehydrogenase